MWFFCAVFSTGHYRPAVNPAHVLPGCIYFCLLFLVSHDFIHRLSDSVFFYIFSRCDATVGARAQLESAVVVQKIEEKKKRTGGKKTKKNT